MPRIKYANDTERITLNIAEEDGCWIWQRFLHGEGYGQLGVAGTTHWAHRFSYEAFVGEIPEGLDLDHLCRNRACVNPDHLEPVTRQVNLLRGVGWPAINAAKTHCKRGHEFTPENTRVHRGGRSCRACSRAACREYKIRRAFRAAGIEAAA